MVRVAVCPKCSHESVMFDQPDSEQWARCPECRTYFQIKHATAREIPQLVMTEDEALLSEEESEGAKETVDSAALETRWDTRSTTSAVSTQTVAGVEPATTSPPAETRNESDDSLPPENGKDAGRRTVSDLSSLATWSDLPVDQIEAKARAEQAGDLPTNFPVTSATPTLRLRRSRDEDEVNRETQPPESPDDSGERFDKWFQTKETIFDFTPPVTDRVEGNLTGAAPPLIAADASLNSDALEQSKTEAEAAADEERSTEDEEPESAVTNSERSGTSTPKVPAWPQGRPIQNWSRPSRRRSPLRLFVMIGFGGIVGTALGYYALLWLFGPQRDFLNAGQYLPSAILPSEFRSPVITVPANDATTSETSGAADLAADDEEPIEFEQMPATDEGSESDVESAADGLAREPAEIVGAPSFSADELAVALGKAKEAQAGLVAGNFDDGAQVKRTKGLSYMAFCDLAQKATFVDKDSSGSYASALDREVHELARTTLADAHAQQEVALLAPRWIKSAKRTHGGIFLAGRVTNQSDKGSVIEWNFELGSGEPLTVLVGQEQAESIEPSARPLAILGWIVDQPAANVHGYTGDATQAVRAGRIISLE
ncbi:MAG TPA: hypothetical protein VGK58_14060 [Lacipirellulaceae bacterium]